MRQFSISDDELADVKPTQPAVAPTPQPAQAPPPPPAALVTAVIASAPKAVDLDDNPPVNTPKAAAGKGDVGPAGREVDFGDEELMKRGDGLNRIRPDKGSDKVVRFSLLPFAKPKAARSHYVVTKEGKSNRLCLTKDAEPGYCCTKLDEEGRMHVVAPALQYLNANPRTGKYTKGMPVEYKVGYVDLSRPNYRSVSLLPEEGQSVYDLDIVMALNGNKYEFNVVSRLARWRKNPELAAEVEKTTKALIGEGGKKLDRKLGRKTTLLEWKALLAGVATGAEEASLDNLEEV